MVSRFSMYKLTKLKKNLAWGELYDESSFIFKFKKKCLLQCNEYLYIKIFII